MNQDFKNLGRWCNGNMSKRGGSSRFEDGGSNPSLRIDLLHNPAALFCMLLCLFSMHERLGSGQMYNRKTLLKFGLMV